VAVNVGNVFNGGVADGGNQIMVAVGCGVSVGIVVSVGGIEVDGRQAPRMKHPAKRSEGMDRRM
jgi:hypothetical protein